MGKLFFLSNGSLFPLLVKETTVATVLLQLIVTLILHVTKSLLVITKGN